MTNQRRQLHWIQGQYLTPQHFQHQDFFHLKHASDLFELGQDYRYGITLLEFNEASLKSAVLEVERCVAVFPGGTAVFGGTAFRDGNMTLPPAGAEAFRLRQDHGVAEVYLAIAKQEEGRESVAPAEEEAPLARYAAECAETADAFSPSSTPEEELCFLRYRARLLLSCDADFAAAKGRYELLKIAELRADSGVLALERRYVPPCLSCWAFPELRKKAEQLRGILAERTEDFSILKRERGARGTAGGPHDVIRVVILHALSAALTGLSLLLEKPTVHPERLYQELRRTLGGLTAFSEQWTVFGAPGDDPDRRPAAYRHDRLTPCFDDLFDRLERLLLGLTVGVDAGVPLLHEIDTGLYAANLPQDFFGPADAKYCLVAESSLGADDVRRELEENAKIGARQEVDLLLQTATRGLPLEWTPAPPEEFPQRSARFSYYFVRTDSRYWRDVVTQKDIAVRVTADPAQLKLTLVRLKG